MSGDHAALLAAVTEARDRGASDAADPTKSVEDCPYAESNNVQWRHWRRAFLRDRNPLKFSGEHPQGDEEVPDA